MALKWMSESQKFTNYHTEVKITANGQQEVSWGKSYIRDIGMLLICVNGQEQPTTVYDEFDDYTIKFKRDDYLFLNDTISIYYIPSTLSLGDIKVVANRFELDELLNPSYNEVAIAISDRKFYIYGTNGWREFVMPFTTQNIGVLISYEKQSIVSTTIRTYELEDIVYYVGTHSMMVFIDGKKVDPSDYTEVDNKTITFLQDLPTGSSEIEFIVLNSDTWEDSNNHNVEYTYNPDDSIFKETIKVGANTIKQSQFYYDTDGNIITEVIVKGAKTITKSYTYDVGGNITGIEVIVS